MHIALHQNCQQHCLWMRSISVCVQNAQCQKSVFLVQRAERTYCCTKSATKSVFRYLVWVFLKRTMPKKCVLGVARRTRTPGHHKYHQECFWTPSMGMFEMHNAKKVFSRSARQTHIPLHPKCDQKCLWVPSTGVLEIHDAKSCVFLVWHAECTDLCINSAIKIVFRYLVWVCLQCTMPKKCVCTYLCTKLPPKLYFDT